MSTESKNIVRLRAGVEHELVFRHSDLKPTDSPCSQEDLKARQWIAKKLHDVDGISVDLNVADTKVRATSAVYESDWTLPYESGLNVSEHATTSGYYDLELASPVADISSMEWIKQTQAIFAMFRDKKINVLVPADTCATHVHISPLHVEWDLNALKSVSKAIIYYERCIDALIDKRHLSSSCCKDSNFASVLYQSDVPEDLYNKTFTTESNDGTASPQQDLMSMLWKKIDQCSEKISYTGDADILTSSKRETPEITRNHRWNFRPLLDESEMTHVAVDGSPHVLGTIEFKQPEGSDTADKAIGWRLFATGFVQAALCCKSGDIIAAEVPTVKELQGFVEQGVDANGCDTKRVKVVFERNSGAEPTNIEFYKAGKENFEEYRITRGDGSLSSDLEDWEVPVPQ
ncbi:uncharacterized protein N0V89_008764 [Didymosphaeria variabile]|uniref:Amidoligase enzyme n=1 Tax=Didymosphaeria variabile TaxID=1932322 RepID=A0A9W8XH29_9PLEO|nr:uncharacterized protein N0V89_008764 [Didymosphaeria variabile]KAJ4350143.1 hypothetical protein N0V89_008764 [Didymosphaeria variabile]